MKESRFLSYFFLLVFIQNTFAGVFIDNSKLYIEKYPFKSGYNLTSKSNNTVLEKSSAETNSNAKNYTVINERKDLLSDFKYTAKIPGLLSSTSTLSSGGGQSETSGYSITSTDGLVDKFTGDFTYQIPLLDVEGYPVILSYRSDIKMNSEASWVGLGWDLNVGAVNREMRGLPDEFNGEQTVIKNQSISDDNTDGYKVGPYIGARLSLFGSKYFYLSGQMSALWGTYTTDYLGKGRTFDFGLQASPSIYSDNEAFNIGGRFSFGYSKDTKRGIGSSFTVGVGGGYTKGIFSLDFNYSMTNSYHSRFGLTSQTESLSKSASALYSSYTTGTSSTIMYGTQTMIPSINQPRTNIYNSDGVDLYAGKKMWGVIWRAGMIFTDYAGTTRNKYNVLIQPAIGYLNYSKRIGFPSIGNRFPIMDFNRTDDGEFSSQMTNLPFSVQTHDVFYANASGLGATFRARRTDVGTILDPDIEDVSISTGKELEAGIILPPVNTVISASVNNSNSESTTKQNELKDQNNNSIATFSTASNGSFDDAVYFKGVGETTPDNEADLNAYGGEEPTRLVLDVATEGEIFATNTLIKGESATTVLNNTAVQQKGEIIRAIDYRPFTAEKYNSVNSNITYYDILGTLHDEKRLQPISLNQPNAKGFKNHLSAVEIVNEGGTKYIFDIPAYELTNQQVTFNVAGLVATDYKENLVSYTAVDNTVNNNRPSNRGFYDKTTTPSYAHAFLLTEMLSSDYVDRTNDGPSLDDIGNYYKFNYTRLYDKDNPYKWRFPYAEDKAFLNRNKLAVTTDDVANYIYGEKEIWYSHSIETKNLIAVFVLEDRDDACSVVDENGGINVNKKLKRLKKIELYNRAEKKHSNPAIANNAKPIQTIEFEYSYELCKANPANINSQVGGDASKSGKLTLKKIRSYSGSSQEMGLYSYDFEYDNVENKDYSYDNIDAWGNYQITPTGEINENYLYKNANQEAVLETDVLTGLEGLVDYAQKSAKNWRLNKITNPTNGTIAITYEADNYSTVQNNEVMEMKQIEGFIDVLKLNDFIGSTVDTNPTYLNEAFDRSIDVSDLTVNQKLLVYSMLTETEQSLPNFPITTVGQKIRNLLPFKSDKNLIPKNVILFKLQKPFNSASTPNPNEFIKNTFFTDFTEKDEIRTINTFLVNMMVSVHGVSGEYENIETFATVSDNFWSFPTIGALKGSSGNYEYAYVIIKNLNSTDDEPKKEKYQKMMHSLKANSLAFIQRELGEIVYDNCPDCDGDLTLDKRSRFSDLYIKMAEKDWAPRLETSMKSFIRVFDENNLKYGGNSRVRAISYEDNWNQITNTDPSSYYNWEYYYPEIQDFRGGATSGNSQNEPNDISHEFAMYNWDTYENIRETFPNETKYTALPIARILFPSASVGYNDMKIVFDPNAKNRGIYTSSFYTSKDFPIKFDKTDLKKHTVKKPTNYKKGISTEKYGLTQGYSIITNDFHGKPRESTIAKYKKDDDGNIIEDFIQSKSTYIYDELGEQKTMVDRNKNVSTKRVAQEVDIHNDNRYIESTSNFIQKSKGLAVMFTPSIPFPVPFPIFSKFESTVNTGYYSVVNVKHINKSAIVSKIITQNLGSINTAENLVYDYNSGNVLVSSLNDEYNDKLYSINYPAHWYYPGLREYSKSQDFKGSIQLNQTGQLLSNSDQLWEGDMVYVDGVSPNTAWVARNNATGNLYLMLQNGDNFTVPSTGMYTITMLQSGRENKQGASMQSLVTKTIPNPANYYQLDLLNVISLSAMTLRDRHSIKCGTEVIKPNNNEIQVGQKFNPYLYGVRADLVMDKQWSWQTERDHDDPLKTRKSGVYESVSPFYEYNTTTQKWVKINENGHPNNISTDINYDATEPYQKWRASGEIIHYNEFGNALESKDQIRVSSAVLYGYNATFDLVPIAQAVNAKVQELGFDGFEDYNYYGDLSGFTNTGAPIGINNTAKTFNFRKELAMNSNLQLSTSVKHTGKYSLMVLPSSSANGVYNVTSTFCHSSQTTDPSTGDLVNQVTAQACSCIPEFNPIAGNEYLVSAWVRNNTLTNYTVQGNIAVALSGTTTTTLTFNPTDEVIDGWRRIEGIFTIPSGTTTITIKLQHVGTDARVYFDDVRFSPKLAGMTTTVYDDKTLLPMATHDGYNFSTFYNYDENLNLVRMRVETIEGIKTISEQEMGGFKK